MAKKYVWASVVATVLSLVTAGVAAALIRRSRTEMPPVAAQVPRVGDYPIRANSSASAAS